MSIHTFVDRVPFGFTGRENVDFVQKKIIEILLNEFSQRIEVDVPSILRVMQRVMEERIEHVPRMNERVTMYICNEVRNHQYQITKHLKIEEAMIRDRKVDLTSKSSMFDTMIYKRPNRLGTSKVGGALRFRELN